MIKVIFSTTGGIGSRLLRVMMASPYSHCGIVAGDDVIEASTHGVRVVSLYDFIRCSIKHEVCEYEGDNDAAVAASLISPTPLLLPYSPSRACATCQPRTWRGLVIAGRCLRHHGFLLNRSFNKYPSRAQIFATAFCLAIFLPISSLKFSLLAHALSPVTVKPFFSTNTQKVRRSVDLCAVHESPTPILAARMPS